MDTKLLSTIAGIVIIFAIGYLAKRVGLVKNDHSSILNDIIIYLTLPAFIFRVIYKADLTAGLFYIPAIAVAATLLMFLLALAIGKAMRLDSALLGSFILASSVGNTGYIAYPLLLGFLGNAALVRGVFYDMFATVIFMLTVGLVVCSKYGQNKTNSSIIKQFFTFVPIYGLILGFALKGVAIPEMLMRPIDIIADVTLGLILLSVGIALEPGKGIKRYSGLIGANFILKLFIAPFLVFALVKLFGLDPLTVKTMTIDASMPTALLTLVFGIKYGLDVDYLSSTIFILTIASVITVPLVQLIIGT